CGLFVELLLARSSEPALRVALVSLPAVAIATCGFPWLFPSYCTPPALIAPAAVADPLRPNVWMYEPLGELLPEWVQALPPEDPLTGQYAAGSAVTRLSWLAGQVFKTSWQTRRGGDRYTLQTEKTQLLTYYTFYFPGWRATLDGQPLAIQVSEPY